MDEGDRWVWDRCKDAQTERAADVRDGVMKGSRTVQEDVEGILQLQNQAT